MRFLFRYLLYVGTFYFFIYLYNYESALDHFTADKFRKFAQLVQSADPTPPLPSILLIKGTNGLSTTESILIEFTMSGHSQTLSIYSRKNFYAEDARVLAFACGFVFDSVNYTGGHITKSVSQTDAILHGGGNWSLSTANQTRGQLFIAFKERQDGSLAHIPGYHNMTILPGYFNFQVNFEQISGRTDVPEHVVKYAEETIYNGFKEKVLSGYDFPLTDMYTSFWLTELEGLTLEDIVNYERNENDL